ncbi:putative ATP-dependent Clp protease [Virgisporangium aliadipatigenens]|uniref:Putative ATP-dependent Clp protease n=1 Tax=Virgisporangium aliadipatigenens TaxID=741659 RepID=A0A8J3YNC8_9ACTN|nr:Clp protease N-terminal domain-containing protein [Virgisporangium aliadipatigenens]GIJ48719.1 putative ATP-dependent Clp protease [Virgisporangium aliadipatigenens]
MFERFTQDARSVVTAAQLEARRLDHRIIGTEHLLLALVRYGDRAGTVLLDAGVTVDRIDAGIRAATRPPVDPPAADWLGIEDADALKAIGIDIDEVRARIEQNFGPVDLAPPTPERPRRILGLFPRDVDQPGTGKDAPMGRRPSGHIPFSPRAKKVLELSLREALRLKHKHIGAEHILLGLLREGEGLAALILSELNVDPAALRTRTEAALQKAA